MRFSKAAHCGAAIFRGMTKQISYYLRSGIDPTDAAKALTGIVCTHGRFTFDARAASARAASARAASARAESALMQIPDVNLAG